jgi:hypothetical protein
MTNANHTTRSAMKLMPKMRARLAALTMHSRHPDAARRNGSKGGRTTASKYKDGRKVWAVRMALKRWHGVPFEYEASDDTASSSPDRETRSLDGG